MKKAELRALLFLVKLRCRTVKLLRSEVTHKARSEVVRFAHNGFITIIHLRPLGRKLHYPEDNFTHNVNFTRTLCELHRFEPLLKA